MAQERPPKLEYSLLCPLVCKYCARRFPWPFRGFWDHIHSHELKYRRFWSGIDQKVPSKVTRSRNCVRRRPTSLNKLEAQTSTVTKGTQAKTTTTNITSEDTSCTPQASERHQKRKSPPLHPKICKYCRRRFFHRFWRYYRHIRSHERRYTKHWYNIACSKRSRYVLKRHRKCKKNTRLADLKLKEKLQEAVAGDTCTTIGDLLTQQILADSDSHCDENTSKDLNENVISLKAKNSPNLEDSQYVSDTRARSLGTKTTSKVLNRNIQPNINTRTSEKKQNLPELSSARTSNNLNENRRLVTKPTISEKRQDPLEINSEASHNARTSKELNEDINPVSKVSASDKKRDSPEPDSETSCHRRTRKEDDDNNLIKVRKSKSRNSENNQDQSIQGHNPKPTYTTRKKSSKKVKENRLTRNLTVKLVRMQIEPKQWQAVTSSSTSDLSSYEETAHRERKSEKDKQNSVHDVDRRKDGEKRSESKKREDTSFEEQYLQELHFLGRRKRPQAGYYSRLTKGMNVAFKEYEEVSKSKVSTDHYKGVSLHRKSSQDVVKENNCRSSKDEQRKDETEGKKNKKEEETDREKEEETDGEKDEDWRINSSDEEDNSSDESYKAEEESESEDELTENFVTDDDDNNNNIVVRVKSENESDAGQTANELEDSMFSISSTALENSNDGNQKIVDVPKEQQNHNSVKSFPKFQAQKDIILSDEYFKSVTRDSHEDSPRYITKMKRLTKEQLLQLQKDRISKKFVNNVPCFKTKRKKFGCKICGKHFAFERYLKSHMKWHTTPRKYACKFCGKSFQFKFKLRDHMNTHTGKTPYRCRICGKGFPNNKNVKSHERFHTGEKPYKCNYCEKRFRLQCMLICHVRYHTGERPYPCPTCGRAFHTNSHMKRHQAVHTGENRNKPNLKPRTPRPKRHPCEYCGKMFSHVSAVAAHRRTHTKEKPFACSICGKRFGHKSHRGRHERTVHGGQRPHKCSYCGKGFTDKSNMKTHEKYVHAWDDASSDERVDSDEEATKAPEQSRQTTGLSSPVTTNYTDCDKTNSKAAARNKLPDTISTTPSAKIVFSRKNKATNKPALLEYSTDQQHSGDDDDDALAETGGVINKSFQPRLSPISISDNNSPRDDSTRSVFDKFVSKTNVNIVVKHTCGKPYKKKIASSHRSNFASSNAVESNDQPRSLFSRLKSSLKTANLDSIGNQLRNAASEREEDGRVSPEHFSSRNTSRCSSESRDFKSTLSRLESIQRNAKLIAETLRRNRRGKTIPHKQYQEPPVEKERMSSLESLLNSLESSDSAVGHWSKTDYYDRHEREKTRAQKREVLPRICRQKQKYHDVHLGESSLDSFTSDEEPPSRAGETDKGNTGTYNTKSSSKIDNSQSTKHRKKGWHLSLTPEMQRRLGRQHRKKKYHCLHCNKAFFWESNLKIHESTHTDGKQHVCQFCQKRFTLPSGLKRHERTHTGEKRFKCRFCPKRFSERYNFTCHERIHTGEKPYKCLTCGMSFVESGSLTKHEKRHSSERPFKCQYSGCNMAFKQLPARKRHEQAVHLNVRYECVFCSMTYSRRETLYAHERAHHSGSKPYLCQHCDRRFADCKKYKHHISKHKEKA